MRQIKFRAIFDGKIETHMSLEGMFAHYENGSCLLEQFTGLHDKNGKEIYEGDILKGKWDEDDSFEYGIVTYGELEFYSDQGTTHKVNGYHLKTIKHTRKFYANICSMFWHSIKVIGNIHSNPELLESKQ